MPQPKFRFWDGKRMIYNGYMEADLSFNGLLVCEGDTIPLQWTGLLDKNGKEIWEGDIVVIPYIDPVGRLHADTPDSNAKVGFENGQFVLYRTEPQGLVEWCEKKEGDYVPNYGSTTIVSNKTVLEVIGNIRENPELLKT